MEIPFNNFFTKKEHRIVHTYLKERHYVSREEESYRMDFYKNYQEAKQRLLAIVIKEAGMDLSIYNLEIQHPGTVRIDAKSFMVELKDV
jgi:hypothetical protein